MKPSGYTGVVDYGAEPGCNGLILDPQGPADLLRARRPARVAAGDQTAASERWPTATKANGSTAPTTSSFKSNGDLYFTDPPYGLPKRWDDPRRELDFCGVYRISARTASSRC